MAAPQVPLDAGIVGPDMPPAPELSVVAVDPDSITQPKRRPRPKPIKLDAQGKLAIGDRVMSFHRQDVEARHGDLERREARYQKFAQFEPGPNEDGANVQRPDMMAVSFREEDAIQNSVMSTRPVVNTQARNAANKDRERKTDLLLDYQFFVEQRGEDLVQNLSADFFRDGQFTALVQWVRERRRIMYTRAFEDLPFGEEPREYFEGLLDQTFGRGQYREVQDAAGESDGWDWEVTDEKEKYTVRFFTEDDPAGVLMEVSGNPVTFDGPAVLRFRYEDVCAPPWAENLQPPGPSNPTGAPHVILVDYPTRDEIIRGIETGFYDLATEEDIKRVENLKDWSNTDRELTRQSLELRGFDANPANGTGEGEDQNHGQMKRLMCFDVWKGIDVVWTVLDPIGLVLRAKPLTEVCPGLKPRRPIAHSRCFTLQNTWIGMGIPEMMESCHDFKVAIFNQLVDAGTLEMTPFYTYRQTANFRPEDVRLAPGVGIPCSNPQTDIIFQRFQSNSQQVGTNLIALNQRDEEALTLVGDLQLGQIPAGKSAALRTSGGVQQVLAQGEARPERLLRRFFMGFCEIFDLMYALDRHFLTTAKKFRAIGVTEPGEDPFVTIDRASDLGDVVFTFNANVLNSSKVALQTAMERMLQVLVSPLFLQMGISDPSTIYRLTIDFFKALGQNAEKYVNQPTPDASSPPITASEALYLISQGQKPMGAPAEGGYEAHMQMLLQIMQAPGQDGVPFSESFSMKEREQIVLYYLECEQKAAQAQQQFAMMQAAAQTQIGVQGDAASPGGGKKPQIPMVSGGAEQINEAAPAGTGTPQ